MPDNISQIKLPNDNTIYDITDTVARAHYCECSTAASTADKTADLSGFVLETGAWVIVKFTVTNTAAVASLTLSVNGTTAKNIKYRNANLSSTGILAADRIYTFVYDGTYWQIVNDIEKTAVQYGFGYGTCSTATATAAKKVSLTNYTLTTGGIMVVRFTYDVNAGATLNVNSKGAKAIYYQNAAITDGVIKAGDTVTFIYSTYYRIIAIDRDKADRDALVELVDNGKKNLLALNFDYEVKNNVTCYHYGGSIFLNGTSSSSSNFNPVFDIITNKPVSEDTRYTLPVGKYVLIGTNSDSIRIQVYKHSGTTASLTSLANSNLDTEFEYTEQDKIDYPYICVRLLIVGSSSFSSTVIKPMLLTKEDYIISTAYKEPCHNVAELTQDIINQTSVTGGNIINVNTIKWNCSISESGSAYLVPAWRNDSGSLLCVAMYEQDRPKTSRPAGCNNLLGISKSATSDYSDCIIKIPIKLPYASEEYILKGLSTYKPSNSTYNIELRDITTNTLIATDIGQGASLTLSNIYYPTGEFEIWVKFLTNSAVDMSLFLVCCPVSLYDYVTNFAESSNVSGNFTFHCDGDSNSILSANTLSNTNAINANSYKSVKNELVHYQPINSSQVAVRDDGAVVIKSQPNSGYIDVPLSDKEGLPLDLIKFCDGEHIISCGNLVDGTYAGSGDEDPLLLIFYYGDGTSSGVIPVESYGLLLTPQVYFQGTPYNFKSLYAFIRVESSVDYTNVVYYPMICNKDEWWGSYKYAPPALTNHVLTTTSHNVVKTASKNKLVYDTLYSGSGTKGDYYTFRGIRYATRADNSVHVCGTLSSGQTESYAWFYDNTNSAIVNINKFCDGNHYILPGVENPSSSTIRLCYNIGNDYTGIYKPTLLPIVPSGTSVLLVITVNQTTSIDTIVKPIILTKEEYERSAEYESNIAPVVDSMKTTVNHSRSQYVPGKNLIIPSVQSYSVNGITITDNLDGSYTLNGTASANAWCYIGKIPNDMVGKRVTVSGCPDGGDYSNSYGMFISDADTNTKTYAQSSTDAGLCTVEGNDYNVGIIVRSGYHINAKTFRPMVCLQEDYLLDSTFVPPAILNIPINANLDDSTFQVPGTYLCRLSNTAATLSNCPTTEAFTLETKQGYREGALVQYVYAYQGKAIWYRTKTTTSWTTWITFANMCLGVSFPTATSTNPVDLNDYITPGVYYASSSSVAKKLTNCPVHGTGFRMEVVQLSNANYLMQTIHPASSESTVYIRHRTGTTLTWQSWYQFAGTAVTPPGPEY